MMTSLVELQQLYLPGLTRSVELIGQKRSKTSIFHTPAEKHEALLITSKTDQNTFSIIVPFSERHRSTAPQKREIRRS